MSEKSEESADTSGSVAKYSPQYLERFAVTDYDISTPVPAAPNYDTQDERRFILELQSDARELVRSVLDSHLITPPVIAGYIQELEKKITEHIEEHKRRVMRYYREQIGGR